LRLLAGLHYLELSRADPALAAQYPGARANPEPRALQAALIQAARAHPAVLTDFAQRPPQTNEVNRSLCLVGGFLTVAQETGLPLRCLEMGASAGLNLNWDRRHYDLGPSARWGDPHSPVRLTGEWSGADPPFNVAVEVAERQGCDLTPIDLADPDQALRLQAYVWADQAIGLAQRHRPALAAMDAGEWTLLTAPPRPGVATVLYHSVVWTYLSQTTRAAVQAAIRVAGGEAGVERPVAWLRMEPDSFDPTAMMEVRLTLWPGGAERSLARVHAHGAKVLWLGAASPPAVHPAADR
jgi:hypothetical protein